MLLLTYHLLRGLAVILQSHFTLVLLDILLIDLMDMGYDGQEMMWRKTKGDWEII